MLGRSDGSKEVPFRAVGRFHRPHLSGIPNRDSVCSNERVKAEAQLHSVGATEAGFAQSKTSAVCQTGARKLGFPRTVNAREVPAPKTDRMFISFNIQRCELRLIGPV